MVHSTRLESVRRKARGFESHLLRHVINSQSEFKRGWSVEIYEINFLRCRLHVLLYVYSSKHKV